LGDESYQAVWILITRTDMYLPKTEKYNTQILAVNKWTNEKNNGLKTSAYSLFTTVGYTYYCTYKLTRHTCTWAFRLKQWTCQQDDHDHAELYDDLQQITR